MKRKYLATLLMILSAILAGSTLATVHAATTITVVSDGTSTFTAGSTTTNPSSTPLDPTKYSLGNLAANAVPVSTPPSLWFDPTTGPFSGSGAVWVSSLSSDGASAPTTGDSWRLFEVPVVIQPGSTGISGDLWFTADNAVNVYLNGVLISSTPNPSSCTSSDCVFGVPAPGPPYPDTSIYFFENAYGPVSLALNAGPNTLDFVVRNWDNGPDANPTGLLFKADVTFTPAPTSEDCAAGLSNSKGPPFGQFVNAGGVPLGSKLVLNIVYKVTNDEDSGNVGYWALDNYNKHVQVWQMPSLDCYYIVARYAGKWTTYATALSPGAGTPELAGASGTFEGGYIGTFSATGLVSSPLYSFFGNIGTFNYGGTTGDILKGTYGAGQTGATSVFDWKGTYFAGSTDVFLINWGWTYHYRSQTWLNYASGTTGDIVIA